MKKILFVILSLFCIGIAVADDVTIPTTYSTNGTVTATNLNGNFQALVSKVNGGLDNDNADTTDGYRFYEVRASFPSVATQGQMVYVVSDLSLYIYDGSNWDRIGP